MWWHATSGGWECSRPLFAYNDGWDLVEGYAPRLLDSVILQPGEKEHLVQDIANFRKSKQRYARLGVPYHRGYLFYGPPGTGKTSLVSALAANFGLAIYAINLAIFNDRSLMNAVNQVSPNSVLLFEDIDCMKSGNARMPSNVPANDGARSARREGKCCRPERCHPFRAAECVGWFLCADERPVHDDHEPGLRPWTKLSCDRAELTTSCFWERPVTARRLNCTAGSSRRSRSLRRKRSWKCIARQKRWRNSRGCCWGWNRSREVGSCVK